ncbi:hypothetical protein [Moorena bouillonii]|nr:hypothetical protein [Moorena bouillonii]
MPFLLFQTTRVKISPATRSADSNADSLPGDAIAVCSPHPTTMVY